MPSFLHPRRRNDENQEHWQFHQRVHPRSQNMIDRVDILLFCQNHFDRLETQGSYPPATNHSHIITTYLLVTAHKLINFQQKQY